MYAHYFCSVYCIHAISYNMYIIYSSLLFAVHHCALRVSVKPGLWTLDWTHGLDYGLRFGHDFGLMRRAMTTISNNKTLLTCWRQIESTMNVLVSM